MLKKFASAALMLVLAAGIALADTVRGTVTSVSDKEVTVVVKGKKAKKGKKAGKSETKTFEVTKDTKFFRTKGKKKKTESSLDELKSAIEKKKKKGVRGSVEVTDGKATEISYAGKAKSKSKKTKKTKK
jgi:hypothetical protein